MVKKLISRTALICLCLFLGAALRFGAEHRAASLFSSLISDKKITIASSETREIIPTSNNASPITVLFAGDVMLDRGVRGKILKYGKGDYNFPFLKIKNFLSQADILFGNLEGPLSDKGQDAGSIYSFRMDPAAINGLSYAGFKVLSSANNHALDWGRAALADTVKRVSDAEILSVGAGTESEAYSPKFFQPKADPPLAENASGTALAFLAFADFPMAGAEAENVGPALAKDEKIIASVKKARETADIVIVSYHFGEEYRAEPTERQKYLAHLAIDNGADLVIGHHPHVLETIEEYNDKYIIYSLGNFVFDQFFSRETMEGGVFKVIIQNKKIKSAELFKIKINKYFQPELE